MLLGDFFDSYFSFDSKLSRTLVPLLFKPGFLTNAYRNGERSAYFVPIRLYIFISIVLFLILPLLNFPSGSGPVINIEPSPGTTKTAESDSTLQVLEEGAMDTISILGTGVPVFEGVKPYLAYYDSLPENLRPNYFTHLLAIRVFRLVEADSESVSKGIMEGFFVQFPKIAFLLLPIFALLLKLLYFRRPFSYEEHFIHSLHFHSFVFLFALLMIPISYFSAISEVLFAVLPALYLFFSMRRIYGSKWKNCFFKLLAMMGLYALFFLLAIIFSLLLAAFNY